jgi:hypothetical protein
MGVVGLLVLVAGNIRQYGRFDFRQLALDSYANVGTGLIDIAITVLIIDRLARRRENLSEKRRLVREMGSRDNSTALRAVDVLREMGALADGSLEGVDLKYANLDSAILSDAHLKGAYLSFAKLAGADLRNADLSGTILRAADLQSAMLINADLSSAKLLDTNLNSANLHGAILLGTTLSGADLGGARGLSDSVLVQVETLKQTIMPTGILYDGRYNLPADIDSFDPADTKAAAAYYGISIAAYRKGQQWAEQNLNKVREQNLTVS